MAEISRNSPTKNDGDEFYDREDRLETLNGTWNRASSASGDLRVRIQRIKRKKDTKGDETDLSSFQSSKKGQSGIPKTGEEVGSWRCTKGLADMIPALFAKSYYGSTKTSMGRKRSTKKRQKGGSNTAEPRSISDNNCK